MAAGVIRTARLGPSGVKHVSGLVGCA